MANTSATWNRGSTTPSLSAMAVNDVKTIVGTKATSASVGSLVNDKALKGKLFTWRSLGGRAGYSVTRIK